MPRTWPGKLNGPPMTLGNMRQLGVQRLVAYCLNPSCRHEGLIDVSRFPDDAEVPSFAKKVVCAKCGARGRHIDVRPNWKEQPSTENLTGKVWR
ncbi:MAG: hypothetical protein WB505_04610 [Pseudolabrys sp.]